jgi:hypothetical protein
MNYKLHENYHVWARSFISAGEKRERSGLVSDVVMVIVDLWKLIILFVYARVLLV